MVVLLRATKARFADAHGLLYGFKLTKAGIIICALAVFSVVARQSAAPAAPLHFRNQPFSRFSKAIDIHNILKQILLLVTWNDKVC
jgi:hypothetical protein